METKTETTDLGLFFRRVEASYRLGVRFTDCAVDGSRLPRSSEGEEWEYANVVGAPLDRDGRPDWSRTVSHTVEPAPVYVNFPKSHLIATLESYGCCFNDSPVPADECEPF